MKKHYKALMLDLDGTTIPNDMDGSPSTAVIDAIAKASKVVHVGFITGRPYSYTKRINSHLLLKGLSIVSGGAQIVDLATHKVMWQKLLDETTLQKIFQNLEKYNYKILVQKNGYEGVIEFTKTDLPKELVTMSVMDIEPEKIEEVLAALKDIPSIASHKIVGWKKGLYWVQVSHAEATKQHAILEIARLLNIETKDIIGVGDGYNDMPLLMACGLKIAMGNAVPELKAIADYVAPNVEDDGVVDVIEKYIL